MLGPRKSIVLLLWILDRPLPLAMTNVLRSAS
jgi:hypothetical protein